MGGSLFSGREFWIRPGFLMQFYFDQLMQTQLAFNVSLLQVSYLMVQFNSIATENFILYYVLERTCL